MSVVAGNADTDQLTNGWFPVSISERAA